MYEISQNIAKNLKELRKNRQLTLEELAEKSGVSKSMLGEIERGRTNPTITVLWKITQALKTPLTTLIHDQDTVYTLTRKVDQTLLTRQPGQAIASIFPYYEPHRMEMLQLTLSPQAQLSNTGHMKGVEEYILVQTGVVEVSINGEKIILYPDDAIRFAADICHEIVNTSTDLEAKLLNLIYYP